MVKKSTAKNKRKLSQEQEFQIMKLVLDKFLWLGLATMIFGLYKITSGGIDMTFVGVIYMIIGALVLGIFGLILIREYEFLH